MKVLYVISGLGLGGAERQIVMLSKDLVRRGHSVCIFTLNNLVPRADELRGSAVELVVDQKRSRLDFALVRRLRRKIKTWQPDMVHGFLYDGNVYARLAGVGLGVPVLGSERNDNYRLSASQKIGYLLTAPWSDGVVANSYAGAGFARRVQHVREGDVHTVWNGIDLREIDERLAAGAQPAREIWPSNVKRVCIVGAIKPQKDHLLALRVARRLVDADPSWRFICVGDELKDGVSGYKAEVLAACEQLGLREAVRFVGHRRDVPELIASSDAMLVTSRFEGFPNVVLEAMACGTPVASTDYSDVRRILPLPWQVVPSRDEAELAGALQRCLYERGAVAASQRRWVETHATATASAEAMLGVYERYVAGGAGRVQEGLS